MKAVRILCCVIATALIGSFASEAKAHGLVGFYVQQDHFGRGLVITRFAQSRKPAYGQTDVGYLCSHAQ